MRQEFVPSYYTDCEMCGEPTRFVAKYYDNRGYYGEQFVCNTCGHLTTIRKKASE